MGGDESIPASLDQPALIIGGAMVSTGVLSVVVDSGCAPTAPPSMPDDVRVRSSGERGRGQLSVRGGTSVRYGALGSSR